MKRSCAYLILPMVLLPVLVVDALMMHDNIDRSEQRAALIKSGEVCVSYRDGWFGPYIADHWRPEHVEFPSIKQTADWCNPKDFPPGVASRDVGFIE